MKEKEERKELPVYAEPVVEEPVKVVGEVIHVSHSDFVSTLKDTDYLIGMAMRQEFQRKRLSMEEWHIELRKFGKREVK